MRLTRIDPNGVPMIVQHISWNPGRRLFVVELWNGNKIQIAVEVLDDRHPYLHVENYGYDLLPSEWCEVGPKIDQLVHSMINVWRKEPPLVWPTPTMA